MSRAFQAILPSDELRPVLRARCTGGVPAIEFAGRINGTVTPRDWALLRGVCVGRGCVFGGGHSGWLCDGPLLTSISCRCTYAERAGLHSRAPGGLQTAHAPRAGNHHPPPPPTCPYPTAHDVDCLSASIINVNPSTGRVLYQPSRQLNSHR